MMLRTLASSYHDDTLLIESDLVLDPAILRACVASYGPLTAAVASYGPWMDGTVTRLAYDGTITAFLAKGSYDPRQATYYKTVNVYRLERHFTQLCLAPAVQRHLAQAGPGGYYEEVFGQLVAGGSVQVKAVVVDGWPWYEVDTADDLRVAEALFLPRG
ncbi:MAG: hypothetical protein AB4911_20840 [Oscillochloridaceae bacterium umkhey_bin13]